MADQENLQPRPGHGKKMSGKKAGKKAQGKKTGQKAGGSGSAGSGSGSSTAQNLVLRVIDANAAPHETNRPQTPVSDADHKEADKENDVGLNTTPRRRASVKKTATPDATAKKTSMVEPSTLSKITRPTTGSISHGPIPPAEDHGIDADVERDTEKTEVGSMEDVGEDRISGLIKGLMDGLADTQEDLCGYSVSKSNGDAIPENNVPEVESDGKFPGWEEYPELSIDENDRESRARDERRYYRAYGVRFAPWNIPFKRRLQTLAVLIHSLSIASTVSFFFFLCAIPLTWPLLIPYLLHMLLSKAATDGRLRFRSERFRRAPIWKFFADYYPARLHKTHELPPTRKYIFGYHPHGIISHGAFAAFATEALGFDEKFPGITNSLLTLDSNFRIPLYREYILSLGIQSVSKESITNILTHGGRNGEGMGRAVTIVIGGARESLEAQPGTMHLVLGERKGFIKLAVRTGADLVPVLAFGENDLYDQVSPKDHPGIRRLQMWVLRTLKFTLPFLHGRGIFNYDVGLMPYRRPLNVVVGKPIKVAQARDGDVDMAEVERLHRVYVQELKNMWDRYKDEFAAERDEEMVILK